MKYPKFWYASVTYMYAIIDTQAKNLYFVDCTYIILQLTETYLLPSTTLHPPSKHFTVYDSPKPWNFPIAATTKVFPNSTLEQDLNLIWK